MQPAEKCTIALQAHQVRYSLANMLSVCYCQWLVVRDIKGIVRFRRLQVLMSLAPNSMCFV